MAYCSVILGGLPYFIGHLAVKYAERGSKARENVRRGVGNDSLRDFWDVNSRVTLTVELQCLRAVNGLLTLHQRSRRK